MPDWNARVRERLNTLSLSPALREEIVAELASHLEESYDALRASGLDESEAVERALAELGDSAKLVLELQGARLEEAQMSQVTTRLWLPSIASMIAITLMFSAVVHADVSKERRGTVMLLALPFAGAVGAYLSRRAGAGRWAVVFSGLFPATAMLCAAMLVIVLGAILGWPVPVSEYKTLESLMVGYTLGLLAGIVPFLRGIKNPGSRA